MYQASSNGSNASEGLATWQYHQNQGLAGKGIFPGDGDGQEIAAAAEAKMVLPAGGSLPMLRKIQGTRGLAIQETTGVARGEGMRGGGAVVTGGWHDGDASAMGGAEVGARRHGDSRSDAAHAQRRRVHTRQTRAEVRIIGDSSPFHTHTHTHTSPLRRINGDTSPLLRVTATLNQGARARGRQWQERGGGDVIRKVGQSAVMGREMSYRDDVVPIDTAADRVPMDQVCVYFLPLFLACSLLFSLLSLGPSLCLFFSWSLARALSLSLSLFLSLSVFPFLHLSVSLSIYLSVRHHDVCVCVRCRLIRRQILCQCMYVHMYGRMRTYVYRYTILCRIVYVYTILQCCIYIFNPAALRGSCSHGPGVSRISLFLYLVVSLSLCLSVSLSPCLSISVSKSSILSRCVSVCLSA